MSDKDSINEELSIDGNNDDNVSMNEYNTYITIIIKTQHHLKTIILQRQYRI